MSVYKHCNKKLYSLRILRIKKKIYPTRAAARSDIFEYIEMFYNSKRRHGSIGQRSPLEYEMSHQQMAKCV